MKNLWIIAIVLFAGCTITQPHRFEYRIAPNVKINKVEALSCKNKSLTIRRTFTSSSLLSQNMKYVKDTYKEFSFTQSKWSRTPSGAISAALVNSVNKQKIFASVSSYKSRTRSDLILETNVEEFIQYLAKILIALM